MIALLLLMAQSSPAAHVLYLGDSHSYISTLATDAAHPERLGHVVLSGLKNLGNSVDYYAACGQRPSTWVTGGRTPCGYTRSVGAAFESPKDSPFPRVATIYDPRKHELVIVNLGDNMFRWKSVNGLKESTFNASAFALEMSDFFAELRELKPAGCVWVGPTYHVPGKFYRKTNAAVDAMYAALAKAVAGKCRLIDSRKIVVPTEPNDGLHHVTSDSAQWGRGILEQLSPAPPR